jgi:uridine phosphorylase
MLNHARGLWGYSGRAADGALLTIQSTGYGGPSLAAVVSDLAALGARRLVRIGTARAPGLGAGSLVVAEAALARDGTSGALGGDGLLPADPALLAGLRAAAADAAVGVVASVDLLELEAPGALAVDLSTAPLFAVAAHLGLAAASVLLVVGDEGPEEDGEARLGDAGLAALRA